MEKEMARAKLRRDCGWHGARRKTLSLVLAKAGLRQPSSNRNMLAESLSNLLRQWIHSRRREVEPISIRTLESRMRQEVLDGGPAGIWCDRARPNRRKTRPSGDREGHARRRLYTGRSAARSD